MTIRIAIEIWLIINAMVMALAVHVACREIEDD